MVPKVAKSGKSFKGAFAYYGHDKQAGTSQRVEFIETLNLRTDDPEKAWRIMAQTFKQQNILKLEAGIKATGRKLETPVFAYSLSWSPDEMPSQAQMKEAAYQTLEELGASDHQAMIIAHNDEPHPHIHILVNRVHPEHGIALPESYTRMKLSRWAEAFEKEQGKIRCKKRVQNNRKRDEGQFVKYQDPVIQRAWSQSDNGKSFAHALKQDGHILARGDRRDFVIVDIQGKVINPARKIEGAKIKDIRAKLADLDPQKLPSVIEARKIQEERKSKEKQRGESKGQKKYAVLKWSQAKQDRYNQIKQAKVRARKRETQIIKKEWADFTPNEQGQQKRNQLHLNQLDEKRALEHWADKRREKTAEVIKGNYRTDHGEAALSAAEAQLKAKQSLFYRITGKTEELAEQVEVLKLNLDNIKMRRREYTDTVENQIKTREDQLNTRHEHEKTVLAQQLEAKREPSADIERDRQVSERIRQREEQQKSQEQDKDKGHELGR